MNTNTIVDFRNPALLRKAGINALQKELGSVGTVYFLRQFELGEGNYTNERDQILKNISHDEVVQNIKELDAKKDKQNNKHNQL